MSRLTSVAACAAVIAVIACVDAPAVLANSAAGWGGNSNGQIGDGTTTERPVPVAVSGVTGINAMAAGESHTLALLSSGKVLAWGANANGELGDGTTTDRHTAVEVEGLSEVVSVAAGARYSLALLKNGKVMAWGANGSGQLGDGTTTDRHNPVEVSGLGGVIAIAAGSDHALALLENGEVLAWGANTYGDLGNGLYSGISNMPADVSGIAEAIGIAAGADFSLALLKGGSVVSWGGNGAGELGTGSLTGPHTCSEGADEFGCSAAPVAVSGVSEATAISAGAEFGLVLLKGGAVDAWGENSYGQLSNGHTLGPNWCPARFYFPLGFPCSDTPEAVQELSEVAAVSGGGRHSLALTKTGNVMTWGDHWEGGALPPEAVIGVGEVEGIASGAGTRFTFGAAIPTLTGLATKTGPGTGGTSVKITGTNFTSVTAVMFGTAAATGVTVESPTTITVTSPSHKLGVADVSVVTTHGTTARSTADQFTYAPEVVGFGRCKKASGEGKYKNSGCTELSETGKNEWFSGFAKAGITFADGTETVEKVVKPKQVLFETTGKAQLLCSNVTGTGEYLNTVGLRGSLTLTGCTWGASKCSSSGASEGEVVTNALTGTLGWREKAGNAVGLGLAPEVEKGAVLEATCGTTTLKVTGTVVGAITPVNSMTSAFTLKFKQAKGTQAIERFEGEEVAQSLRVSISGGPSIQTGLGLEASQAGEEELEINTVV